MAKKDSRRDVDYIADSIKEAHATLDRISGVLGHVKQKQSEDAFRESAARRSVRFGMHPGRKSCLAVFIEVPGYKREVSVDIGDMLPGLIHSVEPRDERNMAQRKKICEQFDILAAQVRRSLLGE